MTFDELVRTVSLHKGEFLCEQIHKEKNTKTVRFEHVVTPPGDLGDVPAVGDLREFYARFGSILFYSDPLSGDAGRYLAPSASWAELHEDFSAWLEGIDEDEEDEYLPNWIETALVVGETPHSGNYILVPTEGDEAGHVFEFDHDGFEFTHRADGIRQYVEALLAPDRSMLTDIASHMRFVEGDRAVQWWIREMKDNRGRVVRTQA